jgi:inositol-phosphate phosphatase / L-galactose 1-phosphate phosphatase / histidinol-phosphatase
MTDTLPQLEDTFIETSNLLADIARLVTAAHFRQKISVNRKSDLSPVTAADQQIEKEMRELIQSRHPDHSIFGEEFGLTKGSTPWQWTLDPIDGTKSFVAGVPTFGSLIALGHHDKPMLGVIEMPLLKERWLGITHKDTTHNGKKCSTSNASLKDAVVLSTTPEMFNSEQWIQFKKLSEVTCVRAFGTDCLGYGLLASGHTDLVIEADLKPYDFLALIPIVEGAGGKITDWNGKRLTNESDGTVLAAANLKLHGQALKILNT